MRKVKGAIPMEEFSSIDSFCPVIEKERKYKISQTHAKVLNVLRNLK